MEASFDLSRFTDAQRRSYPTALREIRSGRKRTHWMWYIFPQLRGLGRSSTAEYYGIQSLDEAAAFLAHPVLGANLREISGALLALEGDNPTEIFGWPDDLKLRSSMTLFAAVSPENSVFHRVLDKYYGGRPDELTMLRLERRGPENGFCV